MPTFAGSVFLINLIILLLGGGILAWFITSAITTGKACIDKPESDECKNYKFVSKPRIVWFSIIYAILFIYFILITIMWRKASVSNPIESF